MKLKYYWKLIKHVYQISPFHVIVSDLALIAMTAAEMLAITVSGKFIDAVSIYLNSHNAFDFLEFCKSDAFMYLTIALLLAVTSLLLNNLRTYLLEFISKKSSFNAWSVLFDKLGSENLQEIESKHFQDLLAFVNSYSIDSLTETYMSFAEGLKQFIRGVTALIIMVSQIGWTPILIIFFVFPLAYIDHLRKKDQAIFKYEKIESIKLMSYLEQFSLDLNNFIEMKVNHIIPNLKGEYNNESGDFMNKILHKVRNQEIAKSIFGVLGLLLTRVYFIFLVFISISQRLTIGSLSALIGYTTVAYDALLSFFNNLFIFLNNYIYFSKYFEFEEYSGFGDLSSGLLKLRAGAPKLLLSNVDFKYPERDEKTLVNINLEVCPGEKVAIIGGDASGKSTLVKILCGLYKLSDGEYFVNDKSVAELARGVLKSKVSIVTQDFNKYYFTVKRNIVITKNPLHVDHELYKKVKEICEIDKFMKRIDLKDDQVLGKLFVAGREISPGLWQRLSIARALYRNREVLVLDEPFTFIDEESRRVILRNIFKFLGKGRSLLYISQNSENSEMFDKIYYLKSGRLIRVK